jgi:dGTPase
VVDALERDGRGLNLTEAVRDGILHHTGSELPATLEGRVVKLVDRVAYINHDIDDALRAGLLSPDELPEEEIGLLGERGSRRIDALVHDLVESSADSGDILQSDEIRRALLNLRAFMFERVYLGPEGAAQRDLAVETVRHVFDWFIEHPDELPPDRPGDVPQRVTDYVSGMTDRFALAWR